MSTASPIHSRLVARSGMELLPVTWFMVYQTAVAPATHRSRLARFAAVDYVLAGVLLVGDVVAPFALGSLGLRLPQGQVAHEVIRRCPVPVPLPRRRRDRVAGPDLDDLPAACLGPPDALEDVQGLAKGMGMPGVAGTRREVHDARAEVRGHLVVGDRIEPDLANEPVRRTLDRRPLGLNLHAMTLLAMPQRMLRFTRKRLVGSYRALMLARRS